MRQTIKQLLNTGSFIFLVLIVFQSCKKPDVTASVKDPLAALNLPATPLIYTAQPLPVYLTTPNITRQDNTPADNAVTDWGATLGRVLFYDKSVSINNSISCASCHKQQFGFSDTALLSKGFAGGLTGRHSMSLVNARYYPAKKFFWDERAATLEAQVLVPMQDKTEMGMNLDTLVARMKATSHYRVLVKNAFGDETINSERVARALAQFIRSIISYQSKFDAGRAAVPAGQDPVQTPYSNFTAAENQGKQLFFGPLTNCATCHGTETFTAPGDRNNGLDNPSFDKGVGGVTNNEVRVGNFKVPSLKNIALTAPYMHDGRFANLEQVIEHYNSGIQPNPNLAPQLRSQDGSPKRMNLTADQKASLVAFLKTLTDNSIGSDVKFATPFRP
ncbi:cytochrome c peroxidase [soil metagenome]